MASRTLDQPDATARRWTLGRVVVTLLVVGMVGMWGYVLYLAFVPGRQPPPDRLAGPAFATAAQARCREALDEVAALPRAVDAGSSAQRAGVVAQANEYFGAMLDDLDRLVPAGEDGELVRAWLADWRTYLGDRAAYVTDLQADSEARLLVSPKDSLQITEYLDAFAGDNHMTACATPLDV